MKRILSLILSLLMVIGLGTMTAYAAPSDGLTITFGTAIYSISKETFIRMVPEPASQAECGEDEFVTLIINITNDSSAPVTLSNPYVKIDGGEALGWVDFTMQPGESKILHVYNENPQYLTPGLHTAVFYDSNQPLYSGRFSIGRDWFKVMKLPTKAQIAARSSDERSPYIYTWLSVGYNVRYDAYCVDFKSDYLPSGTYSSVFNGYMDYSSLKNQYTYVDNNGSISLYGGLQRTEEGTISILSFWDIYCTDEAGNTTIIRPVRIYPAEKTDNDFFTGEGDGAHTLLPFEWKAGHWYRMLLLCGISKNTGNTTVDQWFQDLATDEWIHVCTYDTGIKDSCFIGNICFFSENFLRQYAGEVRSLEVANVRIHTDEGWQDVVSTTSGTSLQTVGVHANAYGSWEAGADENSFYMITTGVSGWGRTENTGAMSIKNIESGSPF